MLDPLLGEMAILVVVALALVGWVRYRDRIRRDIALSLLPLAVLVLSTWLRDEIGFRYADWSTRIGLLALAVHPVLLLRVVNDHVDVPAWIRIAAWGGFAVSGLLAVPQPVELPPLPVAVGATHFILFESYAAAKLFGGAESARGVLRKRLRVAASGSIALAVAIVIGAADVVFWPLDRPLTGTTDLWVLIAATLFLIGFMTPPLLRKAWETEVVRSLLRELSALSAREREEHAMQLLCRAGQSAVGGGVSVAILDARADEPAMYFTPRDARPVAEAPIPEAELSAVMASEGCALDLDRDISAAMRSALSNPGDRALLLAPVASSERTWGVLLVSVRRPPLFPENDLTVLGWLAEHVALRLDADADARARTRLVAQLREANAELERFAYVASHDLREPLRMISDFAALLKRRYRGTLDRDADEFIDYLIDGADRMQRLVRDLLILSRAGTSELKREPVSLEAVLRRTRRDLEAAIEEAGARVTHDPLPDVMGDETQLLQLFQNVIANAIKFRGEDAPVVHVRSATEAGWVQVRVEDNGRGIAPEDQERLFMPFARRHGRDVPGTGMGLAICKRVVERHGGRIRLQPRPGGGTVVVFTLPGREASPRPGPLSSAARSAAPARCIGDGTAEHADPARRG